jgi:hypothetical protein
VNQDPNEYTVTAGGNVYSRPKSSRPVGMPDDPSAWRSVVPQLNLPAADPRNFMELAVAELIAGSPSFDINSERGESLVHRATLWLCYRGIKYRPCLNNSGPSVF